MMNKRRRILPVAALTLLFALVLSGCSQKSTDKTEDSAGSNAENNTGNNAAELTLEEIVEKLYENVDVPPYETVRLDSTTFEYFAFAPYDESLTAVAADALVNITPHSVVVIRAENGNGAEIAAKVAQKADMNKWLCVGAEAGNVAYTDHYVVLIMSEKATVDAVTENLRAMSESLDGMEISLLTLSNSRYEQ